MKFAKKALAVLLSSAIALGAAVVPAFAKNNSELTPEELEAKSVRISTFLDTLLNDVLLGGIAKIVPRLSFVRDDSQPLSTENFYEGDEVFLDFDTENYTWNVGYGKESVIPDDFGVNFKYARGSYCPWGYSTGFYKDDEGNNEDLMVRTVMLDDNTGRGSVVIASVDCIGIANTDVLKIRAGVADLAKQYNIKSMNISAIHSHMAIDSQGVWGKPLTTILHNLLSITGIVKPHSGVNQDYLNKIISSFRKTLEQAYADMKPGTLTYTDIDVDGYMGTRSVSPDLDDNIHRLMFYPENGGRGTMIASFGTHPEMTSYGEEFNADLSSDFVWYMEKLVNRAGSNFIYVQGNVGTNSCGTSRTDDGLDNPTNHDRSIRYGYEMAYICLGANMTTEERMALNDELGDVLGIAEYGNQPGYTKWYDDLPTFEEKKVEAVLNAAHKRVKLEIESNASLTLLKLGLASNDISYNKQDRKYYNTTEIGYLEFGSALKMFLSPGEMYAELVVGGYGLSKSDYKSLRESYGENVILCDLMNDAAGYICPDEMYYVVGKKYQPGSTEFYDDSWCLTVSIGEYTASTLMKAYADLVNSVK